jgi:hypothetical protein
MIFVWNNEPITLGRVEPLDRSRNLKDINCGFLVALGLVFDTWRFFRPHAAFPPLDFRAQSDTDPTRITQQALSQNIASPPTEASGIFHAVSASPQCGRDLAVRRQLNPQEADRKAILVRFRGWREKPLPLGRTMVRNRASISTSEQIFASWLRGASKCRICGPRATMVRESALKVPMSLNSATGLSRHASPG